MGTRGAITVGLPSGSMWTPMHLSTLSTIVHICSSFIWGIAEISTFANLVYCQSSFTSCKYVTSNQNLLFSFCKVPIFFCCFLDSYLDYVKFFKNSCILPDKKSSAPLKSSYSMTKRANISCVNSWSIFAIVFSVIFDLYPNRKVFLKKNTTHVHENNLHDNNFYKNQCI